MRQLVFLPLIVLGIAACENSAAPAVPVPGPQFAISDAVHNAGNSHFFFLSPMVSNPTFAGTFDPGADAVVHICVWSGTACGATMATFTKTSGPGGELVVVDPIAEAYSVKWRTKDFAVDPGQIYRIRVLMGAQVFGFADVQVVLTNKEAKNVNTGEFIPLVDEHILMIRFRIEQGAILPPGPFPITIDATALSAPSIELVGNGSFPTVSPKSFTVPTGTYTLTYYAGLGPFDMPTIVFTVRSDGKVDYAAALDEILEGRGSATLLVKGRTITLDARLLSIHGFSITSILDLQHDVVHTLTFLPGNYVFTYYAGLGPFDQPTVVFTIRSDGKVDYAAALDEILEGRGSATLLVKGRTITLDARLLSIHGFSITSILDLQHDVVHTLTFLPGNYVFTYYAGLGPFDQPTVVFTIKSDGTVDYAAALEGVLEGHGTAALLVKGRTITLDARQLSIHGFSITSILDLQHDVVHTLTFLPGNYVFTYYAGRVPAPEVLFTITAGGAVEYSPALEGIVTRDGTSALTIRGRTVQIDATSWMGSNSTFDLRSISLFPTNSVQPLNLVPSIYHINVGNRDFDFSIELDGTVTFDTNLYSSFLTVIGTTLLRIQ